MENHTGLKVIAISLLKDAWDGQIEIITLFCPVFTVFSISLTGRATARGEKKPAFHFFTE